MSTRITAVALAALAVVLAGVVTLLAFGGPQRPAAAEAPVSPAGASSSASADVPPPDPSSPLHIEIPGCVCHSKDPKVVEEHSRYRMNQCFGCHKDGMPRMGR